MDKTDIFLLTKPPQSNRTKLCLQLIEQSENPALYLAADGVYNLLETAPLKALPIKKILACKEDLDAEVCRQESRLRCRITSTNCSWKR